MLSRPLMLASLLIVAQLTVLYIKRGYTIGHVTPPKRELAELPAQLGAWTGVDVPVDERIRDFLSARSGIDRVYKNVLGEAVIIHVVWTDEYIRMHFPQQCYRESGWDQTADEDIDISLSEKGREGWAESASEGIEIASEAGASFPAKLLTFEQDQQRIQVLYWFQMGDKLFFDRVRHRTLRREVCWGNRSWPPLIKVMLQSSGKHSEDHLRDVAGRVFSWMNEK